MSNHIPPSGIPSASSNATVNISPMGVVTIATMTTPTSSPRKGRKEEGWKEVGRRTKKISIPAAVFPHVVGKGSANLVAIRHATNTHIEIDKHSKQSPHRTITVRGSIDAIKQVQHYITFLVRDPSRDITQLLPKLSTASHVNVGGAKSHVSSHDLTSASTLNSVDEPPVPLPVRSTVSASFIGAAVSTSSGTSLAAKPVYRRTGGVVTTTAVVTMGTKGPMTSQSLAGTALGGKIGRMSTAVDRKSHAVAHSTVPVLEHKSVAVHTTAATTATVTTRLVTSTVVLTSLHHPSILTRPSVAPPLASKGSSTSGAVRRLFMSPASSHGASTTTAVAVAIPASQAVSYPPRGGTTSLVSSETSQRPISSVAVGMGTVAGTSTQPTKPVPSTSVSLHQAPSQPSIAAVAPIGRQAQSSSRSLVVETGGSKVVGESSMSAKPPVGFPKGVSPHGVIGGGVGMYSSAVVPPTSSVIEQPLHQIMNTPTILQEPASQIAKPRKKSTYSDAVGKKLQTTAIAASSDAKVGGHLGGGGVGVGLGLPPSSLAALSAHISMPQPPLSLAPGAWPLASEAEKSSLYQPSKLNPWSDSADKSAEFRRQSFEEDDTLSPLATSLGPIGPPSRISWQQSHPGRGGAPVGAMPTPGSFSPGGSHSSRTSPPGASPQRNELSPAAKSPLLGAAPPGLLPPPDKAIYGTAFRPIQFQPTDFPPSATGPESSGSFQTLIPTPMRNPRPPLLATPPGFGHPIMPQGLHQSPLLSKQGNPASPVPSPEKGSPNKSPPHLPPHPHGGIGKGFNPNAPTFIPRGLQGMQRPANPPTSSILGAPPPVKFHGFVPPTGTSILGSAPQLPTSIYSNTRIISPPTLIGAQQPQPPTMQTNQSSILGQPPPMPPLNPQIFAPPPPHPPPNQQSFPNLPPSRQNQSLYAPQFDGNPPPHHPHHPPSQDGLIHPPGFTLIHFPTPTQNLNGLPIQNFAPGNMKESFTGLVSGIDSSLNQPVTTGDFSKLIVPLYRDKPDQVSHNTNADAPPHPHHVSTLPGPILLAASGASGQLTFDPTSKHPLHHPHQIIGGGSNLFGINLGQLGSLHGDGLHTHLHEQDGRGGEREGTLGKLPPGAFSSKPPGLNQSFPPAAYGAYLQQVSEIAVTSDMMVSTVSGYALVPPGIFTTSESATASQASEEPEGGADSLPPIGTERAHKRSSSLPGSANFPVLAPGINPSNVWSYSGNPTASEDSDWSKAAGAMDSTDWPTALTPPSSSVVSGGRGVAGGEGGGGDVVITPQDNLESVLERVGLVEHQSLFKSNEIDLDALLLMSEKDFSEIGLPKVARVKLLSAFGKAPSKTAALSNQQGSHPVVAMATDSMASQEPSSNAVEELVASLPSNQQSDASQ